MFAVAINAVVLCYCKLTTLVHPMSHVGNKDFESLQEELVFDSEIKERSVFIRVYDNHIVEGVKNFDIQLSLIAGGSRIQLTQSTMNVVIKDDDTPFSKCIMLPIFRNLILCLCL